MSFEAQCNAVAEWIQGVIGEPLEYTDDLFLSLKNGAILCQLMNEVNADACRIA